MSIREIEGANHPTFCPHDQILLILCVLSFAVMACDNDGPCPVNGVEIPASSADSPVLSGAEVTVQGKGFTSESEIWFRPAGGSADVQVKIVAVTSTEITFIVPDVSGIHGIILKQDGSEWLLGEIYLEEMWYVKEIRYSDTNYRTFEYDEQKRLSKVVEHYSEEEISEREYSYSDDAITITDEDGDRTIISLDENGFCKTYQARYSLQYSFDYENGFLSKTVNFADYEMTEIESEYEFKWKDGNCVERKVIFSENHFKIRSFDFYDIEDKFSVSVVPGIDIIEYYKAKGMANKHLVKETDYSPVLLNDKFEYVFDNKGRPVEIMTTTVDSGVEGIFYDSIKITYY